jgi:hypothetical protein
MDISETYGGKINYVAICGLDKGEAQGKSQITPTPLKNGQMLQNYPQNSYNYVKNGARKLKFSMQVEFMGFYLNII